MTVLAIDVGGTHVKILLKGEETPRKFVSGLGMTPAEFVAGVNQAAEGWDYQNISIGFPAPVLCGRPIAEPIHLGRGWLGFDFATMLGRPVKLINDAAMQAVGSYEGGKMLFLGFGTGLGAAAIWDGVLEPLEIGRFFYRKKTFEHYVGSLALKRAGQKKWQRYVTDVVERLTRAIEPDYVVLGGGNTKKLSELPPRCRAGSNANAFVGGFRLWDDARGKLMVGAPISVQQPASQKAP